MVKIVLMLSDECVSVCASNFTWGVTCHSSTWCLDICNSHLIFETVKSKIYIQVFSFLLFPKIYHSIDSILIVTIVLLSIALDGDCCTPFLYTYLLPIEWTAKHWPRFIISVVSYLFWATKTSLPLHPMIVDLLRRIVSTVVRVGNGMSISLLTSCNYILNYENWKTIVSSSKRGFDTIIDKTLWDPSKQYLVQGYKPKNRE